MYENIKVLKIHFIRQKFTEDISISVMSYKYFKLSCIARSDELLEIRFHSTDLKFVLLMLLTATYTNLTTT